MVVIFLLVVIVKEKEDLKQRFHSVTIVKSICPLMKELRKPLVLTIAHSHDNDT